MVDLSRGRVTANHGLSPTPTPPKKVWLQTWK